MELDVHNEQGEVTGTVSFDETLLGEKVRMRLMRDAVLMYMARERNRSTARVKSKANARRPKTRDA